MTRNAILSIAAIATAACGPGFFEVEARYPTEPQSLGPVNDQTVFVKGVTDAREFAAESTSIAVPVVWDDPPARDKKQIIGAKGDSTHPITNIYLPAGQDVESIVRHMLKAAFVQAGYDLADTEGGADLVVEADLKAFWVWMTPGGMTIQVQTSVQADVSVRGKAGEAEFEVDGFNDSTDAGNSPASYEFSLQEGLYDFFGNLSTKSLTMKIEPVETAPAADAEPVP